MNDTQLSAQFATLRDEQPPLVDVAARVVEQVRGVRIGPRNTRWAAAAAVALAAAAAVLAMLVWPLWGEVSDPWQIWLTDLATAGQGLNPE